MTDDVSGPATPRRPRGFAALKAMGRLDTLKDIASRGGRAAHACGTAHEFTADEARAAGSKGGRATHAKRRASQPG
jgi:general stress protein YciG